jgi:predicted O-methyltransferase YrrM
MLNIFQGQFWLQSHVKFARTMSNLLAKAATWTKCFVAVRKFASESSTEELLDFCLSQPLAPLQIRSELLSLAKEVARLRPRNAMEIGSYLGGTLFLFCRLAHPDARILSVDMYRGNFGGARKLIYYSFVSKAQKLHVIHGDSHSATTQSRIVRKLGPAMLDFLFIDGDHSYEGVKRDFEMYSPLVRPGGMIAFHDIVAHPPEAQCHVKDFWDEVKQRYRHKEVIESPRQSWAGIGLLYV